MNLSELCQSKSGQSKNGPSKNGQSDPAVQGQLTYCSNIHPGETWSEIKSNLDRYIPEISNDLPTVSRFGIGLRLSAEATKKLAEPAELQAFKDYLQKTMSMCLPSTDFLMARSMAPG